MPRTHLLLLAAVCGTAVATVYAAQPVLNRVGADLGLGGGSDGWVVATTQLGYLAGLALLVPLGDVVDRRGLIAGHLVLVAGSAALVAAAPGAAAAFAGFALTGLFAVVVQTAVAYAAATAAPADRGAAIGTVTSGVVLGILGSRVITGAVAQVASWRIVYAVLAAGCAALAGLVLLVLPADVRGSAASYRAALGSWRGLVTERTFATRAVIVFFLFAAFGTLWSGLALPLAASPWHLGPALIGLFGLAGLIGALGAARAGRWADAGRAERVTGVALALLAASWVASAGLGSSLLLLAIGVVVLDFAVQAVHVSNQHLITTAHPQRTGTAVGGYMIFYSLGSAVGAAATTSIYSAAGWAGCCALGGGFSVAGFGAWALASMGGVRGARRPKLVA